MTRAGLLLLLLGRLLLAGFLAGLHTTWIILTQRGSIAPSREVYEYEGLSPRGATVLAYFVSLTPGTTAVELDVERHRLLIHLLDGRDRERTFDAVRTRFEVPLRRMTAKGAQ